MKPLGLLIFIYTLCWTPLSSAAAEAVKHPLSERKAWELLAWEIKNETDDIAVFSAKVPQSDFLAYQVITTVEAGTEELVALIRNPARCAEWVFRCDQSYLHAQESPGIDLVYTSTQMPFPLKDRDTLARISWQEDPNTRVVTAVGVAISDRLEKQAQHVRIEHATMIWELTPLNNGNTQIKTFGHADPGGDIPAWLTNQLSTEVPVKTLKNLKRLVTPRFNL